MVLCHLLPAFFSKFPKILWNIVWFDFPLTIFYPHYTVCESRTSIAWSKGEKIKTQGEKISYIFPQLDFCVLFSATIKIIGEKIWYYVPYCLFFSQVSHNFMKNCSCSVILSLFFSFLFPCPFFLFLLFLSAHTLFFWYFFPLMPYLFPPPPNI